MSATELDEFTKAYIECALWSSNDESNESGGDPLNQNYDADDIAPEALVKIVADCKEFQEQNAVAIGTKFSQAGRDFWLTRNHHGAGFWDGDWPEDGLALTDASHRFGECDLYVGDDKKLYV